RESGRSGGVAERRSLSGGRDARAALAQPVALAFERDHGCVVDEPVDQGGGDHGVAEDLAPLLEAAVAGDGDRAAFVAARDQGEEQVGGLAFEREVADLVDDEQVVALEAAQLLLELVAILRLLQARDPLLSGRESDSVAVLAGLESERDREVRLAGAGRAGEADGGV